MPAARVSDMHTCPMVTVLVPHVGGPIAMPSAPTVLIGNLPAAGVGSLCTCAGPPDSIVSGAWTVLIGGRPAARVTDMTAHGGTVVLGCFTVYIGSAGAASAGGAGGSAGVGAGGSYSGVPCPSCLQQGKSSGKPLLKAGG